MKDLRTQTVYCRFLVIGFVCLMFDPWPANVAVGQESVDQITRQSYMFEEAEKELEYALFVPTSYDEDSPTPLIVALHGLYSNPQQILRYPRFAENRIR